MVCVCGCKICRDGYCGVIPTLFGCFLGDSIPIASFLKRFFETCFVVAYMHAYEVAIEFQLR